MAREVNGRRWLTRGSLGCVALCVPLAACGGASTDGRWNADGDAQAELDSVSSEWVDCGAALPADSVCEANTFDRYGYADPPAFWLGSQAERSVEIEGAGFFVSDDAATLQHAARFSRSVQLSVGPDGSLEDHGQHKLLGYAPEVAPGTVCLGPLRAPQFAPPETTQHVAFIMNLDPRSPVSTFDIASPDATSDFRTSIIVFDSLGTARLLNVHFNNLGGNQYQYSVVTDGSDLDDGTTGQHTLISTGTLQFTTDGALQTASTPPISVSFAGGATGNQSIELDFGDDITNDGAVGLNGTTQFATFNAVYSQSQDGHPSGTGRDVHVAPSGEVTVNFDSGASLAIGKLALARLPREARLEPRDDGSLRATAESGEPVLGVPGSPGRGVLSVPVP